MAVPKISFYPTFGRKRAHTMQVYLDLVVVDLGHHRETLDRALRLHKSHLANCHEQLDWPIK